MEVSNEINARLNDIASKMQFSNQLMAKLVGIFATMFPRATGTFTMAAASSKVVTDDNVSTTSFIVLMPTNAAAGTLQGSNESLYITPAAGSFTVTTAAGTAAAGNEQFSYAVFNAL